MMNKRHKEETSCSGVLPNQILNAHLEFFLSHNFFDCVCLRVEIISLNVSWFINRVQHSQMLCLIQAGTETGIFVYIQRNAIEFRG